MASRRQQLTQEGAQVKIIASETLSVVSHKPLNTEESEIVPKNR